MILSISFKMTAEIEIRKHKLMFCVLFRGGGVSGLYRICSFIAMKCVYIVFTVSSLVSISLNFNRLLRVYRSFAGGSSMENALTLRLFTKSCDRPQWRSGYMRSGQLGGTGFKFC